MKTRANVASILSAAALLALVAAAPAAAEPILGVQMTPAPGPSVPLTHSDERLAYEVTVENVASPNPAVGTELSCQTTDFGGNPAPSFEYQWLRNGTPIPGAEGTTYTVAPADAGKSLQCLVKGTNDADGAGTTYAPISSLAVSPSSTVEPVPSPAPLSGSSGPTLGGPEAATPGGTANTTAGSKVLTEVITATGSGDLTAGSKVITNVSTASGIFISEINKQEITGTGIPGGTVIEKVLSPTELELSSGAVSSGSGVALSAGALPFAQGLHISGPGIPAGAEITNVSGQSVTLDQAATATASGVAVSGTAELTCTPPDDWTGTGITWSLQWLRNGTPIPGATSSAYTVTSADTEPPSLLQCEATGEDAEGNRAASISAPEPSRPRPPLPYVSPGGQPPTITFDNGTAGPVSAEVRLPAGSQVLRAIGKGWSCLKDPPSHATMVSCSRESALQPGEGYPPILVVAQVSKDAPDTLVTEATVSGGGAATVSATQRVEGILPAVPFGFKAFNTEVLDSEGHDFTQAGGHPFSAGANIEFSEHVAAERRDNAEFRAVNGAVHIVHTELPPGFAGNVEAIGEKCQAIADVVALPSTCPAASAVGGISILASNGTFTDQPIYAIEPEYGTPAQFAFGVAQLRPGFAYTLTPELRPNDDYAIDLVTAPVQKTPELFEVKANLCGFGAKTAVNQEGETKFAGCRKTTDPRATEKPFISLPTRCGDPASTLTRLRADSWEEPGVFAEATFSAPPIGGCEGLRFEPELKARPTTANADSPTGLEVGLHIPQDQDPEGTATAQLKKAVVTLPEGLVVNPSAANGLGACSPSEIGLGTNDPVSCPDASKVGTVSVTTPILGHPLPGTLYIATPHENPFGSLLALYLVVESPRDGLVIKLPGKVDPDPNTGQLTTTFDQNPQAPVEDVQLKIRSGATAPLRTPALCGKYKVASQLTPWSAPQSGPPAESKDSWSITKGPGGGACPSQALEPKLQAGLASPIAATTSPFNLRLSREDGSKGFSSVDVTLPPGLTGYLKGIAQCPDSVLASISSAEGTGAAQASSPSCPAASQVGSVSVGAGAGPDPFYVHTGKAYLAGPYKGAPLSIAIVTPAVAGPFDLGTVVVRSAVRIDPKTAQITVASDPIPTILHGIPLDVRDIRISMDRPSFTLAPTNCEAMSVGAQVGGEGGGSASASSRFQVAECARLPFKPNLKIRLHGATKRGSYQRLTATLTAKPGEANIAKASVLLPHSSFLAQEHIRTICTRVQFAAHACPRGSVYGKATAITPLLDGPLTGPVYLRSSSNPLPDLVVALKGPQATPIEVELAGRVDSKNGGIRNSFEVVPDAPVTKFTLQMQGGKKSLIVNSRNLCNGTQRATVVTQGQNGKEHDFRPVVGNDCTKKAKKRGGGKKAGKAHHVKRHPSG